MAEFLALLTSLLFAANHTIIRRALAHGSNPGSCALVNVGTNLVLMWVLFLWRYDLAELWSAASLPFLPIGILAPGLFRLMVFHGMHRIGVSRTSAVVGATPMVSTVLAILLLNERLTLLVGLGTFSIVAGIVAISYGKDPQEHWEKRHLIYPAVAIAAGALRDIMVRFGMVKVADPVIGATITLTVAVAFMAVVTYARRAQEPFVAAPRPLGMAFLAGFFTCAAYLTMFEAFRRIAVVRVAPLAYTSPLFVALLAPFCLRGVERVTRKTAVGICGIVVGVVLIAVRS